MQEWIGRQQVQYDILTPALLQRFRATIDSSEVGKRAAQGVHWCLVLPDAGTGTLDVDGHPQRGDFLPPISLPRRMWASSTVEFHDALEAGMMIERRSVIAEVIEKQGRSGRLVFLGIDHETRADGVLAVSERQTIVYREASANPAAPIGSETSDFAHWQWQRTLTPAEPLLFRYSALTFNSHRIHYDRPYAVEVERYRGLVVHGPLTATLLLDLASRELGANALARFSFRAQSAAFAGEELHLVGKVDGKLITLAAHGSDGRIVMSAEGVMR